MSLLSATLGAEMLAKEEVSSVACGSTYKILLTALCSLALSANAFAISDEEKLELTPYLIPNEHPVKNALDQLFSSARVTLNLQTMKKAGFIKAKPRKFTKLIVTNHPDIPGYIFKLFVDAQRPHKNRPEHVAWMMRVKGVEKIRNMIDANQWQDQFKAPHKWIYELPNTTEEAKNYYTRYYILVEEDMELLSNKENEKIWKSSVITTTLLDKLWYIVKTLGLSDCAKPANVPFAKDGRIAFIDTQTYGKKKILHKKMASFLSKSNKKYWSQITKNKI